METVTKLYNNFFFFKKFLSVINSDLAFHAHDWQIQKIMFIYIKLFGSDVAIVGIYCI